MYNKGNAESPGIFTETIKYIIVCLRIYTFEEHHHGEMWCLCLWFLLLQFYRQLGLMLGSAASNNKKKRKNNIGDFFPLFWSKWNHLFFTEFVVETVSMCHLKMFIMIHDTLAYTGEAGDFQGSCLCQNCNFRSLNKHTFYIKTQTLYVCFSSIYFFVNLQMKLWYASKLDTLHGVKNGLCSVLCLFTLTQAVKTEYDS